ncbi:hypothetical protein AURDEDRAFT_128530 [Auricularia subglabra TFB-10046 SS5]|uniref:F-box domain-containing protein n=1 Tax=Auricularia subglabra (strain TFB-10046 / SS5) TaxID=717982 RepID=J0D176_AURST|nr:hypothetical protein AURDEDRAFT_128530 [Auricularia subglabra TFB-10046 SS5]
MADSRVIQRYTQYVGCPTDFAHSKMFYRSFDFGPYPAETENVLVYCPALIRLLKSMSQLRKFKFDTFLHPEDCGEYAKIRDLFLAPGQAPRFQLKGITSLYVDEYSLFLLAICPKVNTLRLEIIDRRPDTSHIDWPLAARVRYLHLAHHSRRWEAIAEETPEFCHAITRSMPNVATLVLETIDDAQSVLPKFYGFASLETLVIPDLETLGFAFHRGWCGTPWVRPGGRERLQQLEAEALENGRREMMTLALDVFPQLRRLWIGRDEMYDLSLLRGSDALDDLAANNIQFTPAWDIVSRY